MTTDHRTFGTTSSLPDINELDSDTIDVIDDDDTPVSDLEALRAELAQAPARDDITLRVPLREGWATVHHSDITSDDINLYSKRSQSDHHKGGVNPAKFNGLVVAATNVAILKNGQRVIGEDGRPWTLTHPEVKAAMKKPDAWQTARAFYKKDGHLFAAGDAITKAAGYGEEAIEVDPTE